MAQKHLTDDKFKLQNQIKSFLKKLSEEFSDIRFAAASLSYSTLLAIIPFFIIVLAMFQFVGGLESFYKQIELLLLTSLKEATGATVTKYIRITLQQVQTRTLGITGGIFLLLTTLGLIRNIDVAFHRVLKIKPTKPFIKRMWFLSSIILGAPICLAFLIGLKSIHIINHYQNKVNDRYWFILAGFLVLSAFYKLIPDRKIHQAAAMISAFLTSVSLALVQSSFFWISVKVFKQNKIYGSLASFPIFMLWLLVNWTIILSGLSFCAFLHQKISKKS